jgi:hypothetical protein
MQLIDFNLSKCLELELNQILLVCIEGATVSSGRFCTARYRSVVCLSSGD